ncbi:UNVERIFIED_ORG: hypothetical protein J2W19_000062 [Shinella zoogloeoides]|nr:hypothetical protein [Shinella zoogloeoides]
MARQTAIRNQLKRVVAVAALAVVAAPAAAAVVAALGAVAPQSQAVAKQVAAWAEAGSPADAAGPLIW